MNTKKLADCGHFTERIWVMNNKEVCSECMLREMNRDTYDEIFQGDEDSNDYINA
jgi:hypothetical protein